MWDIFNTLGWFGWIVGAVCVFALLYQRDVNREREKREATEKDKADKKDAV